MKLPIAILHGYEIFLRRSGVDVEFGQRIMDISKSACGKMWTIKTEKGLQVGKQYLVNISEVPLRKKNFFGGLKASKN